MDDFLPRAENELKDLKLQDAQLEATAEGIRVKRMEVLQQIQGLEQSIKVYRRIMGLPGTPNRNGADAVMLFRDEIPLGTIAEMTEQVILREGGEAAVSDIARQLHEVGKLKGDVRSDYATVYGTIRRDKRFRALGGGRFTLAD